MTIDISKMLEAANEWKSKIQAKAPAGSWYQVSNAATEKATIRIYDEISWCGVDAQTFATDLDAITAGEIEVQINSPGGSVFDGLAIFNALRTHPARITTRVDGLAASAASFIAQAGDVRVMVESSQMMIHDAWGYMAGNATDFRDYADFLEGQSANIAELYASRSEMHDTDHYSELMAAETWLSAADAVEHGLADSVLVPPRQPDVDNMGTKTAANAADISTVTPDEPAAPAAGSPAVDVVQAAQTALVLAETSLAIHG